MKNTHIEHPEDAILTGDLSVLDWFTADSNISAKIDGAPAIVWGRNPATGNFFVGTKSVFNKKKIKINESHSDIDTNHCGNVADILHRCFDFLPHVNNIIQGDLIGFGGDNAFCPNTITYVFPEIVTQEIIIAPHTKNYAKKDLRDAIAEPINDRDMLSLWKSKSDVLFVKPWVTIKEHRDDIKDMCDFARQMSTMCEFLSKKEATQIKKQLNACIREITEIDDITLEALAHGNQIDVNILRLWKLVQSIKHDMFAYIETDNEIECYIECVETDHEGYVMDNEYGTYKIINRDVFSHANFTIAKSW